MPLEDQTLVVEPNYPRANELMLMGKGAEQAKMLEDHRKANADVFERNNFWSTRYRMQIYVWQEANGKVAWGPGSLPHHVGEMLSTLGASDAWGIEQEGNAVHTLTGLLRHRQFKQYMLTGMFLERSKRSGVHYLFRRLRPTVAMVEREGQMRILATLCLHPIAYYKGSWAGGMCPTDDVIAHLMLMRGDEHMFWRRANQHRAGDPLAGIG